MTAEALGLARAGAVMMVGDAKRAGASGFRDRGATGGADEAERAERIDGGDSAIGADPASTIDRLVDSADAIAEQILEARADAGGPALACRAGCAWCCHVQVGIAAPEALRIANYLRASLLPAGSSFSGGQPDILGHRLRALDARTRGLDADARAAARLPCAFLLNRQCAIYPVRPLLCRAWNSLAATACQANLRQPDNVPIPTDEDRRLLVGQVALGLDDGIWDVGLGEHGIDLDLTAAVRLALEEHNAARRWLADEPVFADARF